jgi:protein gp37
MGTAIEWADETWNPVTGCDRVSPGCDHCYALTLAKRLKAMGSAKYQNDGDPRTSGPGFGLTLHPDTLRLPLRWQAPRKVFVNSMSDLFHARVPREFVARVFAVMAATPQHTYQILTKRPERMARILTNECQCGAGHVPGVHLRSEMEWAATSHSPTYVPGLKSIYHRTTWPLPNVWLGTSVENDEHLDRADHLRRTPAAVRFLSLEPLLGPLPSLDLDGIDWVIVGGESGAGHRPMDLGWARDIRDHCVAARVPFFFKQVGGRTPKAGGRELDGRTWDEYPHPPDAATTAERPTTPRARR